LARLLPPQEDADFCDGAPTHQSEDPPQATRAADVLVGDRFVVLELPGWAILDVRPVQVRHDDHLGDRLEHRAATLGVESGFQLLLKQSPSTIDVLQKTFNLTDEEKFLLLESGVGEGIFFAGLKHVAIKIIASYTEDQIITSDPSQVISIRNAKREFQEQNQ
jgi:hypothetical protein